MGQTLLPLRFIDGVVDVPLDATPHSMAECINVHGNDGLLEKRLGMQHHRSVGSYTSGFSYLGAGTTDDSMVTMVSGATPAQPDGDNPVLYFGSTEPFYQFDLHAESYTTTESGYLNAFRTQRQLSLAGSFEYWNGTTWTAIDVATRQKTFHDTGNDSYMVGPLVAFEADGSLSAAAIGYHISGLIVPPTDWAQKSIDSKTRYYMRVTFPLTAAAGLLAALVSFFPESCRYTASANRVKSMVHFRDRNNARHEFVAYQYGDDSVEMRYELDGANLTVGDALQPDGNAKVFDPLQIVTAFYHKSTDRIIGCIDNFSWFYLIPNEGSIFALLPDDVGTDTPYENLAAGLRSAIPLGSAAIIHDDRLWVAKGNVLYYSAPGVYADIWPNDFEIALGDGGGDIVALATVAGVLVAFKRNSIWVIQAAGPDDEYIADPVPATTGCIAPRGVATYGNVAYFPAEDGIYAFDGQNLQMLSGNIRDFYLREVPTKDGRSMIGVFSTKYNEYRLYYPSHGETLVADRAVYVNVSDGAKFFFQGAYAEGDYGFQATAVCVDQTLEDEGQFIGDQYGCIWAADTGYSDGPTTVKAKFTSSMINIGRSQKSMVRWVTPTQISSTNLGWTLYVYADGKNTSDYRRSLTFTPQGDNPDGAFVEDGDVVTTGDTFPAHFDRQTLKSGSVQVTGRFFQIEGHDTNEAPWSLDAIELEVNRQGRRG